MRIPSARLTLVATLLATAAAAQERPILHAAFAGSAERAALPGLTWFCETWLPAQPQWPADVAAREPFVLDWTLDELRILPSRVELPAGVAAAGTCTFAAGQTLLWRCGSDGVEDWFAPRDWLVPKAWRTTLSELAADACDEPRTLDAPVLLGHLAGAFCEGDPRRALLVGAASCGPVTWTAWTTSTHLRVRGRSGGGLALPAGLLAIATTAAAPHAGAHALRAFAAADGDRTEAARQLGRDGARDAAEPLRALLHGDDAVRLTAIDALVRLGAVDDLPAIVAAAAPDLPYAEMAAGDALRILWPFAPPTVRRATRAALAASASTALRAIDLAESPAERAATRPPEPVATRSFWPELSLATRARLLAALGILALSIYGCWLRERELLRACGA